MYIFEHVYISSSERLEIQGASTNPLSIQAANTTNQSQPNTPRSVYVGRLSEATTPTMIRDHLNDIGVTL